MVMLLVERGRESEKEPTESLPLPEDKEFSFGLNVCLLHFKTNSI